MTNASAVPVAGRSCCCQAEQFTETEIKVLCLVAEEKGSVLHPVAGQSTVLARAQTAVLRQAEPA